MSIIAGVDIGNSTTEAAVARIGESGSPEFLASGTTMTTGIKGTVENIPGVVEVLEEAAEAAGIAVADLDLVLLNEATPVIGDVAMETVTETIVTESSMVGHNPGSPGGGGIGVGRTLHIRDLEDGAAPPEGPVIAVIPQDYDFEVAAGILKRAMEAGAEVQAGIVQGNDGVLIANRLPDPLPFVDEVAHVEKVPLDMMAAVEVAPQGQAVRQLSNPYGIATLFSLSPEDTTHVIPIAKALVGLRSAVVIRTPAGDVQSKQIPAGSIKFIGENQSLTVELEHGADAIMETLAQAQPLSDVEGESGTNVGGMIENVRQTMADVTEKPLSEVNIHDVLAVDCLVPQQVVGGVADEFSVETATGLAIMVDTDRLLMERVAETLSEKIGVEVELGGVEANTAILGALTTPGIDVPVAIIDGGAGSTDGAELQGGKDVGHVHLAGAGNMVTLLIKNELGLERFDVAERIKIHPLARVESLFHIRHEDNGVQFFEDPVDASLFARVVLVTDDGLVPIDTKHTLDRIRTVRQEAKRKVLLRNALRVLRHISPSGNIRFLSFVAIVGRLGLDFELPQMLMNELSRFGIVVGVANVRGELGPTNAVATGLIVNYCRQQQGGSA